MEIKIIAIGKKMPSWINEGFLNYFSRFNKEIKIKLIEIPTQTRTKNSNLEKMKNIEGDKILKEIKKGPIIALDEQGESLSSKKLAKKLTTFSENHQNINIIIGGPDGLAKKILEKANEIWSLSKLTLPHSLVRIILIEQLYRAFSIIKNHPYHRE